MFAYACFPAEIEAEHTFLTSSTMRSEVGSMTTIGVVAVEGHTGDQSVRGCQPFLG